MRRQLSKVKQIIERIKSFLLPTSTQRFKDIERHVEQCYRHDIDVLEKDRNTLKYLALVSRNKRMELLDELRDGLPRHAVKAAYGKEIVGPNTSDSSISDRVQRFSTLEPEVEPLTSDQEDLLKAYLEHVKTTRLLKEHLDDVNKDLEEFKYIVKTQAVAELTNYRGLHDWGDAMRNFTGNYATALAALSIAGAGLVYSTIFGANRGNLGLMTLTFPLFTVGFLIPGFVHIGMHWAASVPKGMTFASQRFWTAATFFALITASIMVIGAIVIVNVTILQLHGNPGAPFILVEVAGIISLAFSGAVMAIPVMAFIIGLFSERMRTSLKKYLHSTTSKERDALNTFEHV